MDPGEGINGIGVIQWGEDLLRRWDSDCFLCPVFAEFPADPAVDFSVHTGMGKELIGWAITMTFCAAAILETGGEFFFGGDVGFPIPYQAKLSVLFVESVIDYLERNAPGLFVVFDFGDSVTATTHRIIYHPQVPLLD